MNATPWKASSKRDRLGAPIMATGVPGPLQTMEAAAAPVPSSAPVIANWQVVADDCVAAGPVCRAGSQTWL